MVQGMYSIVGRDREQYIMLATVVLLRAVVVFSKLPYSMLHTFVLIPAFLQRRLASNKGFCYFSGSSSLICNQESSSESAKKKF
jgi:hypothetical protein